MESEGKHKAMKEEKKENILSTSIEILKREESKKILLISITAFLIVYSFLYGFWKIPIIDFGINRLSGIGFFDYLFVIAVSALTSIFLSLFLYERRSKLASASSIGGVGGGFAGIVGAICPVCQSIGIVAFGSTLLNIPTAFLTPYLGFLKVASIGLLGMAVYFKADSIHSKKCKSCEVKVERHDKNKEMFLYKNNIAFGSLVVLTLLLVFNNLMIPKAFATTALSSVSGGTANLGSFEYGPKITLKPMPLAQGEQPAIQGYRSKVKPIPTISELQMKPLTGNAAQDLVNNVVPSGTPWYGQQAGVSFDDPITAQNLWAKGRAIQLSPQEEQRWGRIVNSFTCDYCCGSPQNPTIITRCGCAHSLAAQGMAKWFIKNYGSSYSDEEIYGEMARWYALWYPGPTVKRILLEAQV
ncbi:hypothetical protein J4458_00640 [Candidatus Woesearchaeota archaeon]|nr:hypothetical protein [Candidatus Woesearchaeota archaeon]